MNLSNYKKDSAGRLVPLESISPVDLARDELVRELVFKADALSAAIREFKYAALGDIEAFIELSAEKYACHHGGGKGNVVLVSYDGRFKIQRAIAEQLVFDERLQAAKQLIDECMNEWSAGSTKEIRTLITDAFQVDKKGNISTARVLTLRRHHFEHPKWTAAMEAIADSLKVAASKTYIRLYERNEKTGKYDQLNLSIASA